MKKVILFLLIISSFLLVGCKKEEKVNREKEDVVLELKEDEIRTLLDKIDELYYFDINPAKSFKISDLTNQEALLWAAYSYDDLNGVEFKELEELAMNYLGFSLEAEDILCMTHSNILGHSSSKYLFDPINKIFVINDNHEKHSELGYHAYVFNEYLSSEKVNDDYIITVNKIFSDTDIISNKALDYTSKKNWYATYMDTKNKKNIVLSNLNFNEAKEQFKKIDKTNLVKYKYTFRLKNDNFVLRSYEIEK